MSPARAGPSGALVAALGAYTLLCVAWLTLAPSDDPAKVLLGSMSTFPLAVITVWLAWRAGDTTRDRGSRRGWRLLAAGQAASLTAGLIWLWHEYVLGVAPTPSLADVAFVAVYPLLLCGLLSFPTPHRSRAARFASWLDTVVVMVAVAMVLWQMLLGPVARAAGDDPLLSMLGLGYATGDLVLLFGAVRLWLNRPGDARGSALVLLAIGIACYAVYDSGYAYLSVQGLYRSGHPWDALVVIAIYCFVLSAQVQRVVPPPQPRSQAPTESHGPSFSLLPYAAVVVGYALLVVQAVNDPLQGSTLDLAIGAAVLTALVVTRQSVTLSDNRRLYRALLVSEQWLASILDTVDEAVWSVDPITFELLYLSPAGEQLYGHSLAELRADPRLWLGIVHAGDEDAERGRGDGLFETVDADREVRVRGPHGEDRWLHVRTHQVRDGDGAPLRIDGVARDVTERRRALEALARQAMYDPLTELPNRALLLDRAAQALAVARRQQGCMAVALLDLDDSSG